MAPSPLSGTSGYDALCSAHLLSCMPFIFQSAAALKKFGIFAHLNSARAGSSERELLEVSKLPSESLKVLMQAAEAFGLVEVREGKYFGSKISYFLLNDERARVNFNFTEQVCYQGLHFLSDSLEQMKPAGLVTLGGGETIYPLLSTLKEPARSSWFEFDHLYSNFSFSQAIEVLLKRKPKVICDIGANTGIFEEEICKADQEVQLYVMDLPEQCRLIEKNMAKAGIADRVRSVPVDLLLNQPLPNIVADVWWMSQFLDCFPSAQVVEILKKVKDRVRKDDRIMILELFVGTQDFEVGDICLASFSLYFTAIANGTSRFYKKEEFIELIEEAGLEVEEEHNNFKGGHTLLVCKRSEN